MMINERENQFLYHIINKAIAASAFNLSEIIKNAPAFSLNAKNVEILATEDLNQKFKSLHDFNLNCVSQKVSGKFQGIAYFIFSQKYFEDVFDLLLQPHQLTRIFIDPNVDEALEISNEIINTFLKELSNKLSTLLPSSLPQFTSGTISELLEANSSNLVYSELELLIDNKSYTGSFKLIFTPSNFAFFLKEISLLMEKNDG